MRYLKEKRGKIATRQGPNGIPEPAWMSAPPRLRQSDITARKRDPEQPSPP